MKRGHHGKGRALDSVDDIREFGRGKRPSEFAKVRTRYEAAPRADKNSTLHV
ncbi:hypothetical protein D3C72_2352640 [compost metagenome]